MAEPIEMPFGLCGLWTRARPRKHVFDGVHIRAAWRIRLNRPCAAAMRSFVKLLCQVVVIILDSTGVRCQSIKQRLPRRVQLVHRCFISAAFSQCARRFSVHTQSLHPSSRTTFYAAFDNVQLRVINAMQCNVYFPLRHVTH